MEYFDITPAESAAQIAVDRLVRPGDLRRYGDASDIAPGLENAAKQYAFGGLPVIAPQGTYYLRRPARLNLYGMQSGPVFRQGFDLSGHGVGTQFVTDFSPGMVGAALQLGGLVDNFFDIGIKLRNFSLIKGSGGAGGIELRRAYQTLLENLWIRDLDGDLLYMPTDKGDADACGQTLVRGCRLEAGRRHAVYAPAKPGANENSLLTLQDTTIRGIGNPNETSSAPTTCGIHVNGQLFVMDRCLVAECYNAGLWLPGGPGVTTMVRIQNSAFENNTGAHIMSIGGVDNLSIEKINLYNNATYRARAGIELNGDIAEGQGIINNVDINGVVVRATPENSPYTAIKIWGRNAYGIGVPRNVSWQNFGHPGQVRFDVSRTQPAL